MAIAIIHNYKYITCVRSVVCLCLCLVFCKIVFQCYIPIDWMLSQLLQTTVEIHLNAESTAEWEIERTSETEWERAYLLIIYLHIDGIHTSNTVPICEFVAFPIARSNTVCCCRCRSFICCCSFCYSHVFREYKSLFVRLFIFVCLFLPSSLPLLLSWSLSVAVFMCVIEFCGWCSCRNDSQRSI